MFEARETQVDRRDYLTALAGLLGSIHSLRILAEKGIAAPNDIRAAKDGIEAMLDRIPPDQVSGEQIQGLKDMLLKILLAALQAEDDRGEKPSGNRNG